MAITNAGRVLRSQCQRFAAEYHRLQASGKRTLERLADEGVLVRAEVPRSRALGIRANRSQIQDIRVAGNEVLEQARHLRPSHWVIHMVEEARQGQDLALADELLIEIGVEKLDLFAHRARQLGLLHALGIGELLLAELEEPESDRVPGATR